MLKKHDPDVIWTRNLLIWSQTRYRCATEPARIVGNFTVVLRRYHSCRTIIFVTPSTQVRSCNCLAISAAFTAKAAAWPTVQASGDGLRRQLMTFPKGVGLQKSSINENEVETVAAGALKDLFSCHEFIDWFCCTGWPKKMCTHENFNCDFD